ncbi:MAG: 2-phosphosulfolactate phosphatase [Candidatus Hadarchaeales archaeon]
MRLNVTNLADKREKIYDTVILVDVLRAGTSIATAIDSGCKYILPFKSIKNAVRMKKRLGVDAILVGEHYGLTPRGFDLNNSPAQLRKTPLKGKVMCFRSSNLTRILERVKRMEGVKRILIGCLANAKFLAEYIKKISPGQVHIVICGNLTRPFNLEDFVGAGAIVSHLRGAELTDMAMAALLAYENRDAIRRLWDGRTAKHVVEIGFKEDMPLCIREDYLNVVPIYRDGKIFPATRK